MVAKVSCISLKKSRHSDLWALKFLPGGWLADPEGRKRWLRQVRATARIQHTNVVRLYRIEETSRWYVMVLEYVSGGTLRERARKPLAPRMRLLWYSGSPWRSTKFTVPVSGILI